MEFPEGGGGALIKNPFRLEGTDILWNYTMLWLDDLIQIGYHMFYFVLKSEVPEAGDALNPDPIFSRVFYTKICDSTIMVGQLKKTHVFRPDFYKKEIKRESESGRAVFCCCYLLFPIACFLHY